MTATKERTFTHLFWILALLGLVADQVSKYAIFGALYNGGEGGYWVVLENTFHIEARYPDIERPGPIPDDHPFAPLVRISGDHFPFLNRGALWGIGQGNAFGFAMVSLFAAFVVVYWAYRTGTPQDRILNCSLGLILAGTLGNLYDRLIFDGVRDFMHWFRWFDWAVFNIADVCLVVGAGLLLYHAFVVGEPTSTAEPSKSAEISKEPAIPENAIPR